MWSAGRNTIVRLCTLLLPASVLKGQAMQSRSEKTEGRVGGILASSLALLAPQPPESNAEKGSMSGEKFEMRNRTRVCRSCILSSPAYNERGRGRNKTMWPLAKIPYKRVVCAAPELTIIAQVSNGGGGMWMTMSIICQCSARNSIRLIYPQFHTARKDRNAHMACVNEG